MPWTTAVERDNFRDMIKVSIQKHQRETKAKQASRHSAFDPQSSPPGSCHSKSTIDDLYDPYNDQCYRSRSGSVHPNTFVPLVPPPNWFNDHPNLPYIIDGHHAVASPEAYAVTEDAKQDSYTLWQQSGDLFNQQFNEASDNAIPIGSCHDNFYTDELDQCAQPWLDNYIKDHERPLLDHFINSVSKQIFPVWDITQNIDPGMSVIVRILENHTSFVHCCLSVSAMHQKAIGVLPANQADTTIMDQRSLAVKQLCESLERNEQYDQVLESNLAMILFPCSVGSSHETVTDIAWHEHFSIAHGLIETLDLVKTIQTGDQITHPNEFFNMTIAAWIDILGATMRGCSPMLASVWRELNIGHRDIGLSTIMGCSDTVMFLISEIACLEEKKAEGMEEVMLCGYIEALGNQFTKIEQSLPDGPFDETSPFGASEQIVANITNVFRIAARIYLCSLVPGLTTESDVMIGLVTAFTKAVDLIPAGEFGLDRVLAWPLLMAGSQSTLVSPFREMLEDRFSLLNAGTCQGSLARVRDILYSLWAVNDFADDTTTPLHWRDIMAQKGMDPLLI